MQLQALAVMQVAGHVVRQQAMLQILKPIFEPAFHPSSHGFRQHRGAHTAIAQAKEHLEAGYQGGWILICRNFSTGSIINACSTGWPTRSSIGGCCGCPQDAVRVFRHLRRRELGPAPIVLGTA
jgi:hypothetical protein